jgi:hypothetical protein
MPAFQWIAGRERKRKRMIQSKIKGLGARIALLAALSALMVAAGASAASAEPTVTPNTGIAWTGEKVLVSGSVPAGTAHVAIVVCNATGTLGKRCDKESGTPGFITPTAYEAGVLIPLRRTWADFDFTKGTPATPVGTSTTCISETETEEEAEEVGSDPCLVVVNFYETTEKGPKPIGSPDTAPVLFE